MLMLHGMIDHMCMRGLIYSVFSFKPNCIYGVIIEIFNTYFSLSSTQHRIFAFIQWVKSRGHSDTKYFERTHNSTSSTPCRVHREAPDSGNTQIFLVIAQKHHRQAHVICSVRTTRYRTIVGSRQFVCVRCKHYHLISTWGLFCFLHKFQGTFNYYYLSFSFHHYSDYLWMRTVAA